MYTGHVRIAKNEQMLLVNFHSFFFLVDVWGETTQGNGHLDRSFVQLIGKYIICYQLLLTIYYVSMSHLRFVILCSPRRNVLLDIPCLNRSQQWLRILYTQQTHCAHIVPIYIWWVCFQVLCCAAYWTKKWHKALFDQFAIIVSLGQLCTTALQTNMSEWRASYRSLFLLPILKFVLQVPQLPMQLWLVALKNIVQYGRIRLPSKHKVASQARCLVSRDESLKAHQEHLLFVALERSPKRVLCIIYLLFSFLVEVRDEQTII